MQAFLFVRWMRAEYKCKCMSDTLSTDAYGGNQSQRVQQSKVTEIVFLQNKQYCSTFGYLGLLLVGLVGCSMYSLPYKVHDWNDSGNLPWFYRHTYNTRAERDLCTDSTS